MNILTSGYSYEAIFLFYEVGALSELMPEVSDFFRKICDKKYKKNNLYEGKKKCFDDLLRSLDKISIRKANMSQSVILAVLLLLEYKILKNSEYDEKIWINNLCFSWALKFRITKRDRNHLRLLLSTYFIFKKEQVENRIANYIIKRTWFKDAILFYVISLISKKEPLIKVEKWKFLASMMKISYKINKS